MLDSRVSALSTSSPRITIPTFFANRSPPRTFWESGSLYRLRGGRGGFAGFFRFPAGKYRDPVLVSGTDGVGTKVKVAAMAKRLGTVGIDLVAMCVNDILVHGAEPLFFLDYYATGKLSARDGAEIVSGIAEGGRQAGSGLLRGEIAWGRSASAPGQYGRARG